MHSCLLINKQINFDSKIKDKNCNRKALFLNYWKVCGSGNDFPTSYIYQMGVRESERREKDCKVKIK